MADQLKSIKSSQSQETETFRKIIDELFYQTYYLEDYYDGNQYYSSADYDKEEYAIGQLITRFCLCKDSKEAYGAMCSELKLKISKLLDDQQVICIFNY